MGCVRSANVRRFTFLSLPVFHAPPVFNKDTGKRERKRSVAGIVVQVIEKNTGAEDIKLYTECFPREGGMEYDLRDSIKMTVSNALKVYKVNPQSVVCWRDGIAESAFEQFAREEILGIRQGFFAVLPFSDSRFTRHGRHSR